MNLIAAIAALIGAGVVLCLAVLTAQSGSMAFALLDCVMVGMLIALAIINYNMWKGNR
jgi:hypothetical protein